MAEINPWDDTAQLFIKESRCIKFRANICFMSSEQWKRNVSLRSLVSEAGSLLCQQRDLKSKTRRKHDKIFILSLSCSRLVGWMSATNLIGHNWAWCLQGSLNNPPRLDHSQSAVSEQPISSSEQHDADPLQSRPDPGVELEAAENHYAVIPGSDVK